MTVTLSTARITLALALSLALAAAPALAQTPAREQKAARPIAEHPRVAAALALLETWLEAQRAYDRIPGISAGVVHDQQIVWSAGYGHTDLTRQSPATPATIYSICSISKLFTSVGVMQLRDAGKLRLDDPVGKYLSWFRIKQVAADAPDVTIEGLLTHSSGLPRESDYPYWTGPDFTFPTREQVIGRVSGQEALYPASTYFQYSNLGLTLAGEVVAAASGQSYDDYVRRSILDPLGLRNTTTEMPESERGGRLATGYGALTRDGTRQPVTFFNARGIGPAAGFASTVEDLARFASWQFRLLAKGGSEVLRAHTLREMHRVHWVDPDFETTWGLGFAVWRNSDKTFIGHGGSCPGYRTQLLLRPDEKIATIFMANALGVNSQLFAQRMYDIVSPAIKAAASDSAQPKASDATLARYVGTYESSFGGEFAVVAWDGSLAVLSLPTMDPLRGLIKLKKSSEHTFRRVRKDEALGEPVAFEVGPDGKVTRLVWHSNHYRRVR